MWVRFGPTWAELQRREEERVAREKAAAARRRVSRSGYAPPIASAELSRRVEKVVGYLSLSEMADVQRREFHGRYSMQTPFEDLPGKWQAAIRKAEQNRPNLRVISGD